MVTQDLIGIIKINFILYFFSFLFNIKIDTRLMIFIKNFLYLYIFIYLYYQNEEYHDGILNSDLFTIYLTLHKI